MDNYAHKNTSAIQRQEKKRKPKKMKTKPVSHFQIGYIHIPVKLFWVLRLITWFNVGKKFTTTNTSNTLSEIPCLLNFFLLLLFT